MLVFVTRFAGPRNTYDFLDGRVVVETMAYMRGSY